jgi:hypothetical protein
MKLHVFSIVTGVFIAILNVEVVPVGLAADTGEAALGTQATQMDSLATSRGESNVTARIGSDFSAFAGSQANAEALVTGLRNGTAITLTSTDAKGVTTTTTFTPPTGKMGYGNVYISLALAKQQLAGLGIIEPSAQQLQAALMGGTVTGANGQTTTLAGVLQLRAQGMGWGQIAQSYGFKLGPVISGMKSANAQIASQSPTGSVAGTATSGAATSSNAKSGIVTGAGTAPGAGDRSGQGHAYGRGIVTGAGTPAGAAGQGHAYGRGIVSGTGAPAGQAGAQSPGQGKAFGKN